MQNKHYSLTILMSAGAIFLVFVLLRIFNVSLPIAVTTSMASNELSVVGEGKVDVVPDTAYIDLGITVNNASTVQEAKKQIDDTNNKIVAAMMKLNIPKADIKTSNYSIFPNYTYENNENKITGYNGNVNVKIKVKNTELASQVISEGTNAGANQVNGTQFVVEDPAKYRSEARTKAINNAKEQAQKLAADLGIKLGKISNVVEYSPNTDSPQFSIMSEKVGLGGGGGGPSIEQGSQTITSVVTLYFEKK